MLTGGLGSQLVEFVGGVERHRRELPQCRGVELDVGRWRKPHMAPVLSASAWVMLARGVVGPRVDTSEE
jgi:hypothetical protein